MEFLIKVRSRTVTPSFDFWPPPGRLTIEREVGGSGSGGGSSSSRRSRSGIVVAVVVQKQKVPQRSQYSFSLLGLACVACKHVRGTQSNNSRGF